MRYIAQLLLGLVLTMIVWLWLAPHIECVSDGTKFGITLLNSFCWSFFAFICRIGYDAIKNDSV
jgi:hypothetical protein